MLKNDALNQLFNNEEKLLALRLSWKLFLNAQEGMVITDLSGKILLSNPAYTQISGYTPEELIGCTPRVLNAGIHDKDFFRNMWCALTTKGLWKGEVWNKRKNGEIYLQSLTINAIKNESGKTTYYVGILTDISEREQLKKDMLLAGKIQKQLLPRNISHPNINIQTIHQPSHYVSGDIFDFWWDEKQLRLKGYLADIMGHGLSTALQASVIRVLFLQVMEKRGPLHKKLDWVNQQAYRCFQDDTFAAVIGFQLDLSKKQLTYAPGGIHTFIRKHQHELEVIKCPGFLLGMMPDTTFERFSLPLSEGDEIYLMSDGLLDRLPLQDWNPTLSFEQTCQWLESFLTKKLKDDASAICIQLKKL